MSIGQKLAVEAILALLAALMLWLTGRALRRGVVKVDPLFFLTDLNFPSFDVTIRRATMPLVYWPIVLVMMGIAAAFLAGMGVVLFVPGR